MSEDEVIEDEEMGEESEIDLADDGGIDLGDEELLEEDAFGAFSAREIE